MRSSRYPDRLLLAGLLLCLFLQGVRAQTTFPETDRNTYRQYLGEEWDSLIRDGHKAIRHNIDYAYLRARMGVAYEARGAFIPSSWQYARALAFNSADTFSTMRRYGTLMAVNRPFDARAEKATMSPAQLARTGPKTPFLQSLSLDLGYCLSNAYSTIPQGAAPGDIYTETDLYGNDYFADLELALNLSHRITLLAGYTYLRFDKQKSILYNYPEDRLDSTLTYEWGYSNFYSFPTAYGNYQIGYSLAQNEFALGAVIVPGRGVKIMPTVRMISVKYRNTAAEYSSSVAMDTSYFVTGTGTAYTFPFTRTHYGIVSEEKTETDYVVSLTATKDFDYFSVGMAGSWSDLNGGNQFQGSGFVTWYPLGNLDLYGTTGVTMAADHGDGRLLYSQMVGGKLVKWLWAEADLVWGDLSNTNTANGWVVYNNTGRIRYRAGATLILTVVRNLGFTFNYQFFEKESPTLHYSLQETGGGAESVPSTTWDRYQTHNMFLGIRVTI